MMAEGSGLGVTIVIDEGSGVELVFVAALLSNSEQLVKLSMNIKLKLADWVKTAASFEGVNRSDIFSP